MNERKDRTTLGIVEKADGRLSCVVPGLVFSPHKRAHGVLMSICGWGYFRKGKVSLDVFAKDVYETAISWGVKSAHRLVGS